MRAHCVAGLACTPPPCQTMATHPFDVIEVRAPYPYGFPSLTPARRRRYKSAAKTATTASCAS
ncbi:hypothetical protein FIBSPDRAFT_875752 [Athelia psychrophila]|uniref:Uncharacterized protein n=1 Tax=Athelia psychrophila TaxID=1759441 RepID=A0A167XI99_9AGAM|nr:hypothetical protein FIBSPDRAFT_875752 [Fibularhizoctonia sp. CBS 109695]